MVAVDVEEIARRNPIETLCIGANQSEVAPGMNARSMRQVTGRFRLDRRIVAGNLRSRNGGQKGQGAITTADTEFSDFSSLDIAGDSIERLVIGIPNLPTSIIFAMKLACQERQIFILAAGWL